MFKDLYKNANDKIPTEDAYLRVMESVNTKSRKTKYSYGKIAALAACFVLTVSMISVYENFAPKEEEPFTVITPENLPANTPQVAEESPKPTAQPVVAEATETSTPAVTTQPEPVVAETTPEVQAPETAQEPAVQPEQVVSETTTSVAESVSEINGSKTASQKPVTEEPVSFESQNSFVKNQGIPENAGLSLARFTLGDTVTRETYYEYLGKNVEASLVLPEGFSNETPDEHILCLDQTEDFDDRWTFYFTKDDSSIFITTTKNTQNVMDILNSESYEKSNVSGIPACLFEEELQKFAFIEVGGIAYTLSSYGVSDEDFENLIISLTK